MIIITELSNVNIDNNGLWYVFEKVNTTKCIGLKLTDEQVIANVRFKTYWASIYVYMYVYYVLYFNEKCRGRQNQILGVVEM